MSWASCMLEWTVLMISVLLVAAVMRSVAVGLTAPALAGSGT